MYIYIYIYMEGGREGSERTRTHERARTHERTNTRTHEHTNARTHEHTNTRTHEHMNTHTHTHTNTHEHTRTHTNTSTTVAVIEEDAPPSERANERTKERTKRRESPWWQLLHPPTHSLTHAHRTLPPPASQPGSQPANSIGGAHHPRSVVSTRQAVTCCDSTPLTHGTGPFDHLTAGDGLSHYTTDRLSAVSPSATNTHIHSPHSLSINCHRAEACWEWWHVGLGKLTAGVRVLIARIHWCYYSKIH